MNHPALPEVVLEHHTVRIERLMTSGTFELDGGSWDVENNVWLIGDGHDCVVIDAPHDTAAILDAVGDRNVIAVVCTHGHNDHINAAEELGFVAHSPVLLHAADDMLWKQLHADVACVPVIDGQRIALAGTQLTVIHTPGHSPGSICLCMPELGALFSGDTIFACGPSASGRSCSDFPTHPR